MSARSAARRHQDELGAVLAVHHDRPGPVVIGAVVLVWAIFSALTLIAPGETPVLALAPSVLFAVLGIVLLVAISGERLVVCERGLLVGSVALWMRPSVVRYDQIVPGSIAPVTGAQRYSRETGTGGMPQSTVRRSLWTRRGVHFVGPSASEARRKKSVLAALQDPPPRSIDGRWVWFAGVGSTAPQQVTAQIAGAAEAAGAADLARATAAAEVRELSGDPADASRHLPGLP
ncbi:hypothetical protein CFK38_05025 [Brachybacterium vulturis]|uniref:DUF3093 domain-containing protein n=1 Tax=Brachybacterium vulturis TaxID=2017484 RepID=A0A291GL78_9MICO|nr:hypothetical protein [Brachybacterium vulturis]ATG50965.1 hypothetical protein CFK38_05025 [Brachybacterium vulturis]